MVETAHHQMGSPPFCFFKHPLMAIALPLLLLLLLVLSSCSCYCNSLSSSTLTLLVVVLSTIFSFIFSKIKQLHDTDSIGELPEIDVGREFIVLEDEIVKQNKASHEDGDKFQIADASSESNSQSGSSIADERLLSDDVGDLIPWKRSVDSIADDESLPENVFQLMGSSQGSISDDDSLIEIALPNGHYVGPEDFGGGFLADFSPESVFRRHGLVELLSEISDQEDNLIEIDISIGSIKCSRFEIEA